MSLENLKEYARRCVEEPELRAKAREFGIRDLNAHQELAASLGLDWTMHDMDAFQKEVIAETTGTEELDEEDLQNISGGIVTVAVAVAVASAAAVGILMAGTIATATASASDPNW